MPLLPLPHLEGALVFRSVQAQGDGIFETLGEGSEEAEVTQLEIAIEALKEIRDADFSFEGHACLHCETADEALRQIERERLLNPREQS